VGIGSYIRLTRIDHAIIASFAALIGLATSVGGWDEIPMVHAMLGMTVTATAEIALFVFNDIFNIEEDRINAPERPLVQDEVSLRSAFIIGVVALVASILFSVTLGFAPLIIVASALISGMAYNVRLKRTGLAGNIIVAFDTSLPFIFGSTIINGFGIPLRILVFSLIAFTATLGREILKGIKDIEGDMRVGVKTLAASKGVKIAARLSALLLFMAVALSPLPLGMIINETKRVAYLIFVAIADALFIYSAFKVLGDCSRSIAERARKTTLLAMSMGTLAFAVAA